MSDPRGGGQLLYGGLGGGHISNVNRGNVFGVCIKSPLSGFLTINGIVDATGQLQKWDIPPGTSGYCAPPGTGDFWSLLSYRLSDPADFAKAFIAFST